MLQVRRTKHPKALFLDMVTHQFLFPTFFGSRDCQQFPSSEIKSARTIVFSTISSVCQHNHLIVFFLFPILCSVNDFRYGEHQRFKSKLFLDHVIAFFSFSLTSYMDCLNTVLLTPLSVCQYYY